MVSAKSISYADRAKNGRPSAGHTQAKPSPITTTANSVHSARTSDANYPVLTAKSEEDGLVGIPTRAANGVVWPNDHSAASSDFTAPTTSTTLNGSDSSPSTPVTPPSVAATALSTKPNVWTVRKELMNAVRSTAATPPHNATSTSSNHNLPHTKAQPITTAADLHSQSSQPSVPAARSKPKRSAIPSDSGNTQSPAINQAQMTTPPIDRPSSTTPATTKKKANPKSVSTSAQSTPAESPIPPLDEASSWPAPQEAASAGTGPSVRRESHPAGSEENKQGPPSHSRESSTVGSAHGKKQHWVRMSPAELQEAADNAQPPSPHLHGSGRAKRGPDGERRPVPGRVGPGGGGRSSGRNSKRSSAAPSPTTRPNGLPSSGSATTPTLNANAVPFSSRNFPSQIYGQPGQRSHPHSPMGRSPFLSSHPQSLVNSPRMGGGYGSPRRGYPMQNTPPPNTNPYNRPPGPTSQTSALVTISNKPRIRRKAPSKAEALSGAILELRLDDNSFRPTFGTIEPVAQGGMGLGLSVPGQGVGAASELAQAPQAALELADDAVRWDEAAREPTEAEKILRAEGKFGIGTAGAEVPASSAAQEEIAAVTEQEVPAIAVEGETTAPTEGEDRPDAKPQWSFGSVDRPTAEPSPTPSDLLVVDPSRRPPYTMPFSDSPGPNGIINGYAQYDNMGRGSPNYSNNRVSPVDGQQQVGYAEGGAVNGYGSHRGYPSGRRPGRGGPRGSYGNRGGYGPRQPMSNTNSPGGYYSSGPTVPQQPIQPPQPEYSGYSYGVYYPPPPPPMEYNPYGFSDPYAAPPPPPQSSVPPPTPGGAQAGEGSPYMVMPPYGYPVYPPPPPSMVNPMMGYYYPPPGPQGFYPPPPPMPAVGYPLDEPRASILRQVEFYLSYQNMTQDNFLRTRMDSQGWVDVEMIASFNRLRRLTTDLNLVRELMSISSMIEVSPDGQKCRMANNAWQMFVAPQMEGIPSAENQGAQPQFVSDVTNAQHPVEHVPAPPEPQEEQNAADPSALAS